MSSISLFAGLVAIFTAWYFSSFPRNYFLARQTGLPIFLCPVNPANPFWLVFSTALQPTFAHYLPHSVYGDRIKVAIYGWQSRCRYTVHARLGPVFVLVTPGRNEVWIADPEMAHEVLTRRKDFLQLELSSRMLFLSSLPANVDQRHKLILQAGIMSLYGPNLLSSNGDEWQRHRKIVAPVLNERIMSTVWEESSAQTREMLDAFTVPRADKDDSSCQNHQEDTNGVVEGVRMLAINVLGSAIYGSRRSWTQASSNTKAPAGYKTTLMQAIVAIIDNHIVAVFIPPSVLSLPFMPKAIRQLGASTMEFPRHADDLIAKERGKPHGSAQNNFIGVLVKNAEDQKRQVASPSKHSSHMYLSEEEIIGNLFNFTIAAFDTLASVMAYAIMALAIHSEWQGWIMDEIDNVGQLDQAADYKTSFSLLTRCLALMYETLRLYPPVAHVTRCTSSPQTLHPNFTIPADTTVFVSGSCVHVSPSLYSPDPLSFRPTRWIISPSLPPFPSPSSSCNKTQAAASCETLIDPPRGTFLPWSEGPRACPGMKMAQVEFVAVMREIFSKWRVEAVGRPGDTPEMARQRLQAVVDDSQPKFTLQVRRPKDVVLRWVRR